MMEIAASTCGGGRAGALVVGVGLWLALGGCGGSAGPANGGAGGNAPAGGRGGASAGTGGASAGTGGALSAGTGGGPAGTGGASAGSGGASAGTGGASAGAGGGSAGRGGASAGRGGVSGGAGGTAGAAGATGGGASDEVHAPFIAVGEAAQRAFSADGKSWTTAADPTTLPAGWTGPPLPGDNQWLFRGVCYGAGKYLAVGGTGGDVGLMMVSADGKAWSLVGGAQANDDCAYALGRWATGKRTSLDGTTWTLIPSPISSRQMVFGGGLFVSVTDIGTGAVNYSTDGQSWKALPITYVGTDTNRRGYQVLARGGGHFISANTVRADAPIFEWDGVSPQSFTETPRASLLGSNVAITALAYGRGKFVIATGGALFERAAAGGTWTKTTYTGTGQIWQLVVTPDLYVAPDAWSTDGVTWTPATNPPSATRIIGTGP